MHVCSLRVSVPGWIWLGLWASTVFFFFFFFFGCPSVGLFLSLSFGLFIACLYIMFFWFYKYQTEKKKEMLLLSYDAKVHVMNVNQRCVNHRYIRGHSFNVRQLNLHM